MKKLRKPINFFRLRKKATKRLHRDLSLPSDTVNFSSLGAFKRSLQLVNFDEFLRYSLID